MALWFLLPGGMREFLAFAVQRSQLPYTIVLGFIMLYWMLVIVGAFHFDFFGVEIDTHVDADAPDGAFHWLLGIFNIGELPIMLIVTLCILGFWTTAMITGMLVPPGVSTLFRVAMLPMNLVVGALLAVPLIKPVAWLFRQNEKAREVIREEGSLARLRSALEPEVMGQAMIERRGAPVMLNVKLVVGETALESGREVVVVAKEGDFYRVKPFS